MPLTRLTLRQCEAFAAVADTLGFATAGERLGLSSSAVSQLIAELESTVGFRVFDRSTRRVGLSSAGRDFLPAVISVLRQMRLAETAATDVRHRTAGIVRIGAPPVLAGWVLPAAAERFLADRPKVAIRIRDVPVDALVERVAEGELDLAIGPDRMVGDTVSRETLFDSAWVLWCAPSHPLAERRQLRWADLRDVALVAAGRDHERSVAAMHASAPEGTRVHPVDVVDNITTALGLAARGLAVTLAPAYVAAAAVPMGLVSRRVLGPEAIRQVCIYRPVTRAIAPAAEAFAEHLAAWLPAWHRASGGVRKARAAAKSRRA